MKQKSKHKIIFTGSVFTYRYDNSWGSKSMGFITTDAMIAFTGLGKSMKNTSGTLSGR